MNTTEPTDRAKHLISMASAAPGAIAISLSLQPDPIHLVMGLIGIVLLAFGAICEGSIRQ